MLLERQGKCLQSYDRFDRVPYRGQYMNHALKLLLLGR
jgi:hypothetical protein